MEEPRTQNPPKLSRAQRLANGQLAVAARQERSLIKKKVSAGELSFFDVLSEKRPALIRMRVAELLEAVPGVGKRRTFLIMSKAGISPTRRIGGLGPHQLKALKKELILNKNPRKSGKLIVMSGPGGVGKSTISKELNLRSDFWVSVSATTREPREGEIEGEDYFYVSDSQFDKFIRDGEFLEWAEFAGNRYGTLRSPVNEKLESGINVLLEIEIAGSRQIKKLGMDAIFVFIKPPSWEELEARLSSRGTDSPERRAARLALAREEMAAATEFDHILVNTEVKEVALALVSLATSRSED